MLEVSKKVDEVLAIELRLLSMVSSDPWVSTLPCAGVLFAGLFSTVRALVVVVVVVVVVVCSTG